MRYPEDVLRLRFEHWLFLVAAALLVIGCERPEAPLDERPPLVELTNGWSLRWTDGRAGGVRDDAWLNDDDGWQALSKPGFIMRGQAEYLWLRVRLPDEPFDTPAVRLGPVGMEVDAYVSGRHLYSFGETGPNTYRNQGYRWHLIDLPHDYRGKWLHLRIRSRYSHVGMTDRAVLASRSALLQDLLMRDLDRLLAAGLMAMLALGAALVLVLRPEHWRILTSFVGFSAFAAAYSTHHTYLKELLLDRPAFWMHLWLASIWFIPAALLSLIDQALGPWPGSKFRLWWQAHLGLAVVYNVCSITLFIVSRESWPIVAFTGAVLVARLLVALGIVVGVWVLVRESKKGTSPRRARVVLLGIVGISLAAAYDLCAAFGLIRFRVNSVSAWAWLLFVFILAAMIVNNINERVRAYAVQLELQQRDRELMVRDLHDGLGALTTNIRMLAQVAGTTNDGDRRSKALRTIGELSGEGLAEIRRFVQSSDEEELDWHALASDLRHFGAQLLEPHGVELRFSISIVAEARPLTGVASYHIRRIVSEAVTNVVKHSRATTVAFDFRVSADAASVEIADDGVDAGPPSSGIDLGIGLANMRARAEQLGGEFEFSSNGTGGHVLRFTFPLKVAVTHISPTPASGNTLLQS